MPLFFPFPGQGSHIPACPRPPPELVMPYVMPVCVFRGNCPSSLFRLVWSALFPLPRLGVR